MNYSEQSDKLAGPIGLLKQCVVSYLTAFRLLLYSLASRHDRFITRTGRETAEDATQIFGGRGVTQTGMGKLVENVSASDICFLVRRQSDILTKPTSFAYACSTIAHLHTMPFLGVQKTCWETWVCDRQ